MYNIFSLFLQIVNYYLLNKRIRISPSPSIVTARFNLTVRFFSKLNYIGTLRMYDYSRLLVFVNNLYN